MTQFNVSGRHIVCDKGRRHNPNIYRAVFFEVFFRKTRRLLFCDEGRRVFPVTEHKIIRNAVFRKKTKKKKSLRLPCYLNLRPSCIPATLDTPSMGHKCILAEIVELNPLSNGIYYGARNVKNTYAICLFYSVANLQSNQKKI